MFKTTVWAGSKLNINTGSGYGINIPLKIRDELFQKNWKNIELDLNDIKFYAPITDAFWNKCNEIRSPKIGKWLIRNDAHTWTKGKPTQLEMIHIEENKFKVLIKKF